MPKRSWTCATKSSRSARVCAWFVHEQELGLVGERPRDGNALLHSAGQLPWISVAESGQTHRLQTVVDPSAAFFSVEVLVPQGQIDISVHGFPRKQRSAVLLEDHGQAVRDTMHCYTLEFDRPTRWIQETGKRFQQGSLAATGGTYNRHELAGLDLEADIGGHDLTWRIGVMKTLDREHVHPYDAAPRPRAPRCHARARFSTLMKSQFSAQPSSASKTIPHHMSVSRNMICEFWMR
jgi:hypothetical protein